MTISITIPNIMNYIKKYKITIIIIASCGIIYLYKKKIFSLFSMKKAVVFDLDETLGYWVQIGILVDSLEKYIKLNEEEKYQLFDLYPEIVRPEIGKVLQNLKVKKEKGICDKVIIYTNNQGPTCWANLIKNYLNNKLKYDLFDQVIGAYKVNGRKVEKNRTSHMKNVPDLLRCSQLSPKTEICFIDDQYHDDMEHEDVFYIYIKPYKYDIPFNDMVERFLKSKLSNKIKNKQEFKLNVMRAIQSYRFNVATKTPLETQVDIVVSKKLINNLNTFFKTKNQTKRKNPKNSKKQLKAKKTLKRRRKKDLTS
jgi:hypothetical protein